MSDYNEFILEYAEDLDNADIFEEFDNYCIQEGFAKLTGAAILSIPRAILGIIRWMLETLFKFLKKLKNKLSAVKIKADENGNVKVLLPKGAKIDDNEITSIKTFFKNIMTQYKIVLGMTNQFIVTAAYDLENKSETNPMLNYEKLADELNKAKNAIETAIEATSGEAFFQGNLKFDTEVEIPVDQVKRSYINLKNLYVDLNGFAKDMNRSYKELNKLIDKLNKNTGK